MTTTTKTPDTSHLKAGMYCTIRFRHPDDWDAATEPVTGVLEDVRGGLCLGRVVIRYRTGETSAYVAEVVDPAPPKVWPVGTRLTDGTRYAIRTEVDGLSDTVPWFAYITPRFGDWWLTDSDVADWVPVEDDRPEVVDLPDGVEFAHDADGALWVRNVSGLWVCLTGPFSSCDDDYSATWPRVAVAPSRALPDGHVPIDLRDLRTETLLRIAASANVTGVNGRTYDAATKALAAACHAELDRRGE